MSKHKKHLLTLFQEWVNSRKIDKAREWGKMKHWGQLDDSGLSYLNVAKSIFILIKLLRVKEIPNRKCL